MIGIDLQNFTSVHAGGKDQVAFNLLAGFQKMGVAQNLIIYCRKDLKSKVEAICPDATVKELSVLKEINKDIKNVLIRKINTFLTLRNNTRQCNDFYEREIQENNITSLLFTDKNMTLSSKLPCRTFFITHDIQYLIRTFKIIDSFNSTKLLIKKQMMNAFRFCDEAICISDYDLKECKKRFSTKMTRIYDPIVFLDKFNENTGSEYITAINIQHPHKNPVTLVRAFALIKDQIPENVKLLFIGNNLLIKDGLIKEIERLNISDRVIFSGFVSESQKEELLDKTRLFVNPSLFEGFGMAAIEVMAMGIPCLVADNTAQRESTLGLCRYYAPATDEKALAYEILEEFNKPTDLNKRKEISEIVRKEYDYVKIAKEYWDLLN